MPKEIKSVNDKIIIFDTIFKFHEWSKDLRKKCKEMNVINFDILLAKQQAVFSGYIIILPNTS